MNKQTFRTIGVSLALVIGVTATVASTSEGETGGGGDQASSAGDKSEVDDVRVTGCSTDAIGWGQATLRITNDSSKASDYSIEVAFESADGSTQLATGVAFVSTLQPDQSKVEEVSSLTEMEGDFKCKVISVRRSASI